MANFEIECTLRCRQCNGDLEVETVQYNQGRPSSIYAKPCTLCFADASTVAYDQGYERGHQEGEILGRDAARRAFVTDVREAVQAITTCDTSKDGATPEAA